MNHEDKIRQHHQDIAKAIHSNIEPDQNNDIIKGKAASIGETREWGGKKYKKQGNGKWVEVSWAEMTKKEHEDKSKEHVNIQNEAANKKDIDKMNLHRQIAIEHKNDSSKLSDKEHDEAELEGGEGFKKDDVIKYGEYPGKVVGGSDDNWTINFKMPNGERQTNYNVKNKDLSK